MNASFKDITNPNQRMPVMVHSESIDRNNARLSMEQRMHNDARKILHKDDRVTRRSRSASEDGGREIVAMENQIQANQAVQEEFDTRVDAIG